MWGGEGRGRAGPSSNFLALSRPSPDFEHSRGERDPLSPFILTRWVQPVACWGGEGEREDCIDPDSH